MQARDWNRQRPVVASHGNALDAGSHSQRLVTLVELLAADLLAPAGAEILGCCDRLCADFGGDKTAILLWEHEQ